MNAVRLISLTLAGICTLHVSAAAQDIKVGGQVRPRFEYRKPFVVTSSDAKSWVSMRARAHLTASLERNLTVFVQVQDVRIWGEEQSTLFDFSANNFDLHQGYIDLHSNGPTTFAGRAGRQEVSFGGQRLVGAVNWTQQARSFDGLKLSADGNAFRLDLLGAVIANDIVDVHDENAAFWAAYGQLRDFGPGTLDLYTLYNRLAGENGTDQVTMGGRWWGQSGVLRYRAEGSYQTGERFGTSVSAFMLGARLGSSFASGKATVTLWYDYLSGDDNDADDKVRVFDTLFATNHKFYGLADYFLNIPLHTDGRGLQDLALKGSWVPAKDVTLRTELHRFQAAKGAGLSTSHFGDEIDLTGAYRFSPNLNFSGGFAYVFAADGWAEINRLTENAVWTFLMIDATF